MKPQRVYKLYSGPVDYSQDVRLVGYTTEETPLTPQDSVKVSLSGICLGLRLQKGWRSRQLVLMSIALHLPYGHPFIEDVFQPLRCNHD